MADGLLPGGALPVLPISAAEVARARRLGLHRREAFDLSEPVIAWVERTAAADPARPAVADGDRTLSYAQLVAESRLIAAGLEAAGVGTGSVVAVSGRRSATVVPVFLAIELLGAVYLAVDGSWPARRVRDVLIRAAAELVVTVDPDPSGSELPPGWRVVPAIGPDQGTDRSGGFAGPPRLDGLDQPRYVLFTSGSTGTPKGAVVEHRGMLNHLLSKVHDLALGPHDVVAQTAPLGFDISLWQMLAPLLASGQVLVLPDAVAHDPAPLAEAVRRHGVTVLELVPTMVDLLLDELEQPDEPAVAPLPALRWLLATGEELPAGTARRWLDTVAHAALLNAYGPTECSDDVTHHRVRRADLGLGRLPIGGPVANTSLYVLRPDGDGWCACDAGEAGELFIGGIGVGRGYLNDPERTAESFFRDPFEPTAGSTGRLYRSGDAVRVLPDGSLQYLGRMDRQVKISGVRVELGEIEAILGRHPGVRACAVVVHES